MSLITDEQLRIEAAEWVQDTLDIMNDNGSHWTQARFKKAEYKGGEFVGFAYCMMGGLGATLEKKNPELTAEYGLVDLDGEPRVEQALLLLYTAPSLSNAAREQLERFAAIYKATETAIAWASWKLSLDDEAMLDQVVEISYNHDTKRYEMLSLNRSRSVIVSSNDHYNTEWADIVEIHELAIQGLRDGSAPTDWEAASQSLLEMTPMPKNYIAANEQFAAGEAQQGA